MAVGELCLIDQGVCSLLEVPLKSSITSLNLHCNRLAKIEGLTAAWHIRHLDLSSNRISRIEGLGSLSSLRTLNLSCNNITKVEGLNSLLNLTRLNLAYNQISDLTGFLYLHGTEYKLKHLQLHSNHVDNMSHLLQCLVGLASLRDLTLSRDGAANPLCTLPGYREMVLQSLHQVSTLDGDDRLGNPSPSGNESPMDVPGLEDFLEFLISTGSSVSEEQVQPDAPVPTPRIDELLTQFRHRGGALGMPDEMTVQENSHPSPHSVASASGHQANDCRINNLERQMRRLLCQASAGHGPGATSAVQSVVRKVRRDTDQTSESECDGPTEGRVHSRNTCPRSTTGKKVVKRTNHRGSDSGEADAPKQGRSKHPAASRQRAVVQDQRAVVQDQRAVVQDQGPAARVAPVKRSLRAGRVTPDKGPHQTEDETYRTIVEERDQERERRWKAEQAVRKISEQMKALQSRTTEERELQSLAMHTTHRLKELLLKERSDRVGLQARVEELEERCRTLAKEVEQLRSQEDLHKRALHSLEETVSQEEAHRASQQAEAMKRRQEMENRSAVLKREVEILRASVKQYKDKLQHLQELLTSREEAHRKELDSRLLPGGPEFREAVGREVAAAEQRQAQRQAEAERRLAEARLQYAALEDEFRMALTIEAKRFSEVKEGFDHVSAELSEVKSTLAERQLRDEQSGSLVQELTTMVKEQKARIADLIKAKHGAVTELKARLRTLETKAEEDESLRVQLELLKKDKSRLISQLTAQESVIEGLRAERRIWGQELAQQGASLAQDRGRLEAKIEVLTTELETQKKQNERDNDALRIKAKIVDDQTETIRTLKEAVQERREHDLQALRSLQHKLDEETAASAQLRDVVEKLRLRKEELKQQLLDKEAEMDELKEAYSTESRKWQDKADLLTRLESQVKRMKESFDTKERALQEERDKAAQAHKAAVEKLHCVDDAFRRQLESIQASHQAELLRLANEKHKQLEQADLRVLQVEDEMRQLLEETESNKRAMEEKMRRLTNVLRDF